MGMVDKIAGIWSRLHASSRAADSEGSATGFERMLGDWRQAAVQDISDVSHAELEDLVKYALSAPGVVVGRALARHWPKALEGNGLSKTLEVSWKGLRNYLSSRLFMKALTGNEKRYPEAIRRVAIEGNLESVLDEHLWIASRLGGVSGAELADELMKALQIRTSNFYLHTLGKKARGSRFSLRCHAAMPFTDPREASAAVDGDERGDGERPPRADELRRAFNTPFWPHVLVTTSVGQEGLDFHAWCDTLVHWDLCTNPVDLEQREGRISRYGGLSIREQLARLLWNTSSKVSRMASPWGELERLAEKHHSDASGLSPWWICPGADVKRFVIDLPASEQKHRLEVLRRQRFLYRLALGQPNQEDLIEVLSSKHVDQSDLKKLGLDLSALSHVRR
jgi:hypothetical protein